MINRHFIREVGLLKWAVRVPLRQFYKRILNQDHWFRLPSGGRMLLPRDSRFASEVYVTNAQVDWGCESALYRYLQGGDFLDIGANIGYYSAYMAPKCGTVVAFEPDSRALRSLRATVADIPNILVVESAVSDFVGQSVFVEEGGSELSHLAEQSAVQNGKSVSVTSIDVFLRQTNYKIAAIKIDAEGNDIKIIQGGIETLRQHRPLILTEAPASGALFALISPLNYLIFAFVRTSSGKFNFQQIIGDLQSPPTTKMLFLVPSESRDRILACVQG